MNDPTIRPGQPQAAVNTSRNGRLRADGRGDGVGRRGPTPIGHRRHRGLDHLDGSEALHPPLRVRRCPTLALRGLNAEIAMESPELNVAVAFIQPSQLHDVRDFLGHANITTTSRYLRSTRCASSARSACSRLRSRNVFPDDSRIRPIGRLRSWPIRTRKSLTPTKMIW